MKQKDMRHVKSFFSHSYWLNKLLIERKLMETSDGNCWICKEKNPPGPSNLKITYWIDCDKCGKWFHCICCKANKTDVYVCDACKLMCK